MLTRTVRKNGTLLYTSTVTPNYPLVVDSSIYSSGATLTNVVISGATSSGAQNAGWSSAVGVSVSGNSLTKTSVDGWNAGAVSTQTISSGDGYVEWTASETTTARMIGLGNGDSSQSYTDIEYALKLSGGGNLDVWESGNSIGWVGTYAPGDVLRVGVEGGVVKYRKNGTLLYASTVTPTYPLLVDSSLYSSGSTLNNVIISTGSGGSSTATINWLVSDHLGTPRMIIDQTGSLANVKRHDYLPFGEELYAGVGGRTIGLGYSGDAVRQKFTSKERDIETGLDYFLARYYSSTQGRFTSADPVFFQAAMTVDPQRFNLYSYTRNNPLRFIDPEGEAIELTGREEERRRQLDAARLAVGKQAGGYLYENKGEDGKYYVGVYTNGPDGKGKGFKDLNEVAGEFAAVIADQKVATIETVAVGTSIDGPNGKIILAPNDKCNCVPSGTESAFAITLNGADENHFRILLPMAPRGSDIDKAGVDPIDPVQMSDSRPGKNDWGTILGHEIGHARARMTGDRDSNGASLRLENKIRQLRDKKAATRDYHSTKEAIAP